jgi:hypothetical protein
MYPIFLYHLIVEKITKTHACAHTIDTTMKSTSY